MYLAELGPAFFELFKSLIQMIEDSDFEKQIHILYRAPLVKSFKKIIAYVIITCVISGCISSMYVHLKDIFKDRFFYKF